MASNTIPSPSSSNIPPSTDLWTFSIFVPSENDNDDHHHHHHHHQKAESAAEAQGGGDSSNNKKKNKKTTSRLVQLQRVLKDDDPRKSTTDLPVPNSMVGKISEVGGSFVVSNVDEDPHHQQQQQHEGVAAAAEVGITRSGSADELTSLLKEEDHHHRSSGGSSSKTKSSSSSISIIEPLNPTGWTYSSPYWTIQSNILLKMTYKPGWQMIPDYTNNRCSSKKSNNSSTAAAAAACCGSCCDGTDPFHSIQFTTKDIDSMEHLSNLTIRGISGVCSGIRLYLKYPQDCFPLTVPANVPQQYLKGWKQLVENASQSNSNSNQGEDTTTSNFNSSSSSSSSFFQQMKQQIDQDLCLGETNLVPSKYTGGPTITFAVPRDTDHEDDEPPLLWKVEIPPPSDGIGPIALESLTIMDGPLLWSAAPPTTTTTVPAAAPTTTSAKNATTTTTTTSSTNNISCHYKPTHMYINGYQSWSFAGSVPLGQKQPRSAMPDTFSKAFNYGASVPPVSIEYVRPGDDKTTANDQRLQLRRNSSPAASSSMNSKEGNPYLSDFFTCITSHEEELEAQDHDEQPQADTDTADDNKVGGGPRRRRRKKKVIQRPLDETGGPALILGWLSQRQQLGMISADVQLQRLQMHASHQGQLLLRPINTDWAFCQLEAPHTYDEEPMVHYLRAVAGYNQAKPLQNGPLLTGWCSWYHYYENITEESLRTNFTQLSSLRKTCPTNVSVVDDGYMTAWGDWNSLKPNKFSSRDSMKTVADSIREEKMRPGIWLAPFTCDKHSQLAKDHPDWIIRNDQGIPANSSNCGKFFYGLDATNPQVLEYVFKCIRRAVEDWGYTVLKLDFLYASCLAGNGKYDLSLSRAQAMHLALHTIRQAAGHNTFIIGCGCPLGPGVGYADGMRISADTGPTWYPAFPLPWWDHGTLPSLRGMIRNSITRAPMGHRWWHNDPDCLMLGSTTRLTLEEVASSASIVALTCGMLLLSDDLTKVSPDRMRILTKIFPMTGVSAVVLDMHSLSNGHGLPTMLRLWCTDVQEKRDEFRRQKSQGAEATPGDSDDDRDHNEEAGYFSKFATFRLSTKPAHYNERQRSCIHMVKGLGTWTILSLSNWLDSAAVVHIPPMALAPPPEASASTTRREPINPQHGYHVFAFWSSKYSWVAGTPEHPDVSDKGASQGTTSSSFSAPDRPLLSKLLGPHETEIFHIKPVTPQTPQYLGSDIHFSCGQEVHIFQVEKNLLIVQLDTNYQRHGHIFVFVPIVGTSQVKTSCGGEQCRWTVVGNTPTSGSPGTATTVLGRVLQVAVACHSDGRPSDGKVTIEY